MEANLLPTINSPEHYRELFKNNLIWQPAIQTICERHQLKPEASRSELGSHIVYKAGERWIKLMAPIYHSEMNYEVAGLKSVAGRLSVPTPEIIAQGNLEGWPYIVLTDVPGEAIKYAWKKLDSLKKNQVIKGMAQTIGELARCPAEEIIQNRFSWNEFVTEQYRNCESQQLKKRMPEPWRQQVSSFLKRFELNEFMTSRPVFLHCDLTYDHFLVMDGKISGIIDMADCQWGHAEYELAAPCVFVLKGDRDGLRLFLQECGYTHLDQRFSEKLLAWCLLHRYFGMYGFFKTEMDSCVPGDFSQLAQKVFPL